MKQETRKKPSPVSTKAEPPDWILAATLTPEEDKDIHSLESMLLFVSHVLKERTPTQRQARAMLVPAREIIAMLEPIPE